jgi:chemotaxis protein MotA
MDLATIVGLVVGMLIITIVMILDGGSPLELFSHPAAILLIVGGSLAAVTISSPLKSVMKLPTLFVKAIKDNHYDHEGAIEELAKLADKARREGLLALEEESKKINDPFLQKGILLVVDGVDPRQVREILETNVDQLAERHKKYFSMFSAGGGFAPTFGIIGTVMGLISVLKQLSDPNALAKSIASAFLATLWGLMVANLIYLPIGLKLKSKSEEEVEYRTMLMEGILALQAGENPRIVREKLSAYLPPKSEKADKKAEGAKGATSKKKAEAES